VDVEVRHEPAMDVVTDGWDVVVEAPVRAPVGQMRLGGSMSDGPDLFPVLTPAGPGYYRLRVHARGRDTAVDLVRTEPTEDYRIAIWPAPPQPAVIHRHADQYGGNPYYDGDPDAWDRDRQSGRNPEEHARDANLRNIST
jgi:hypothetical protein